MCQEGVEPVYWVICVLSIYQGLELRYSGGSPSGVRANWKAPMFVLMKDHTDQLHEYPHESVWRIFRFTRIRRHRDASAHLTSDINRQVCPLAKRERSHSLSLNISWVKKTMAQLFIFTAVLALISLVQAQCGSGSPHARVTGSGSSFTATRGSNSVYTGSDYRAAIQAALDSISSGQRVAVMASGSIGASTITISSGKIFEGCGTINAVLRSGRGAIESTDTADVQIPYLTMTGNPYFGLRFSGTRNLNLGRITMNLSGGMGIRFDRDRAANSNVKMDVITVTGAGSHAVETWNIDGLTINQVIARNVGESGLLIQATKNARVGLVDGNNVGAGTGYGTLRFANNNGDLGNGNYNTNIYVDKVVSRGGGRGVFCVSQSGGAEIKSVDLASNGNNAILIENCYNVKILGGTVNGGGEVRLAARSEFPNNRDVSITLKVDNTSVRESPCGQNISWRITGNAQKNIC